MAMQKKFASPLALLVPLLLALLACAGCPVLQRQDTPVDEIQLINASTKRKYFLYVPSDYNPQQAYPLMVTLHGSHGFDDSSRQIKEWKALAEDEKIIVLAPQLLSPQGVTPAPHPLRMNDLRSDDEHILSCMQEVKAKYRIDERAVAISSFSAGGYPMYFTVMKHPELFTVIIGRSVNWDLSTVGDIPIGDAFRRLKIYIYFGRTGVSPGASQWDVVTRDSWRAYRYFYDHGCRGMKIEIIPGSHERKPDVAWRWWKQIIAKQKQAATTQPKQ